MEKRWTVSIHLCLSREMIKEAKFAFLPGDPERAPKIAKTFDDNAIKIAYFNERI